MTLDGLVALFEGDFPRAVALLEDALARHQTAGDPGNAAVMSFMLTTACVNLDDPAATVHAERYLALCEAHDAQWSRTHALWVLGLDHFRRGRHQRAETLVRQALRDKPLSYDQWGVAQCLEVLGWCAAAAGHGERAATLLGDAAFAAAVRAGQQLTLEQSVAHALEESRAAGPPPAAPEAPTRLTRRESQVAELVAGGRTNKEIAAELTISRRTAEGHVEHVLTKLGFTSRAQIAAWAARNHTG